MWSGLEVVRPQSHPLVVRAGIKGLYSVQKAASGFEPLAHWLLCEEWVEWIILLFVLFFLGQNQPSDVWRGDTAEQVDVFYFSWPKATSDRSAR